MFSDRCCALFQLKGAPHKEEVKKSQVSQYIETSSDSRRWATHYRDSTSSDDSSSNSSSNSSNGGIETWYGWKSNWVTNNKSNKSSSASRISRSGMSSSNMSRFSRAISTGPRQSFMDHIVQRKNIMYMSMKSPPILPLIGDFIRKRYGPYHLNDDIIDNEFMSISNEKHVRMQSIIE